MRVVVDGLLTNYSRTGGGRSILLLHGWGDSSTGLTHLARSLSSSYDVVAFDLPGFGGTQQPDIAWGLDEFAQFTAHFAEKISVQPYAIIGHSNGGAIAVRGMASGLLHAEKLILVASAGIRGERSGKVQALKYIAKTGKLLTAPMPKGTKQMLRNKMYKAAGSDMLVAERMQDTFKKVLHDDIRKDAHLVAAETLLIYGDKDMSTPAAYGHILADGIPHSRMEIILGAGHFVHIDAQQQVEKLLQDFLA